MENAENNEAQMGILNRFYIRFLMRDTRGMSSIEYALLLGLIVLICYSAWQTFGTKVNQKIIDGQSAF